MASVTSTSTGPVSPANFHASGWAVFGSRSFFMLEDNVCIANGDVEPQVVQPPVSCGNGSVGVPAATDLGAEPSTLTAISIVPSRCR